MAHGDNRGLKLPPRVAPVQVVIVPVAMHKEGVVEKATEIYKQLKEKYRVKIDTRDNYSNGYKFNDWEMRGVPVRIEIGPRDIENDVCVLVRRDTLEKVIVKLNKFPETLEKMLEDIQQNMYQECVKRNKQRTSVAMNMEEFIQKINENQGYIKTMWCGEEECENKIKEKTGAHSRCIPFTQEYLSDTCAVCGKKAQKEVIWGRQY